MKTVGQIIDHLDEQIEFLTSRALDPDRAMHIRDEDAKTRRSLLLLRRFIINDEKEQGTNA